MNTKYVYPAVFTPEPDGGYSVNFPDIENCYTCGDDLASAIEMAQDVLALVLYGYEEKKKKIPKMSDAATIPHKQGEIVNYIYADTTYYRKRFNNKAVKKTLTIPEWLNQSALEANINFSQVLQEALEAKLGA